MLVSPRLVQRGRLLPALGVLMVVCLVVFLRYHSQTAHRSLLTTHLKGPANQQPLTATTTPSSCPELAHLQDGALGALDSLDLSATFRYSRRCVRPLFSEKHKSSSHAAVRRPPTKMAGPLIPERASMAIVNRTNCNEPITLPPCEPLSLDVSLPYPQTTNYSNLLFGVSSSHARMLKALDGFAHWLGGTDAQLIAIVSGEDEEGEAYNKDDKEKRGALEMAYRARGVRLRALPPQNRAARTVVQNHFAVLASLLQASSPQTTWLGIVDDDTFFPSLYKLDQTLGRYNHARPTWLGALSEDFDAVALWGYMAYGGAGVFLSVPLAQQLAPHMDTCLGEAAAAAAAAALATAGAAHKTQMGMAPKTGAGAGTTTGDGLLRDCIYQHTTTKLTVVSGLYQHDLYGDLAGFYESGVLPLSVHHWRSWYKLPLPKMAAVNKLCGDCFLGRWVFVTDSEAVGGESLLSNGYSITQYSDLPSLDLAQMEATWSHAGREFDFSLGPLRRALDETEKKSYRLRDAVIEKDTLRQVYVYKGDFVTDEMDEVFELIWTVPEEMGLGTRGP